jgi:hypothetical protein
MTSICMESGKTGWFSGQLIMMCGRRISPDATWVPGPVTCPGCLRAMTVQKGQNR